METTQETELSVVIAAHDAVGVIGTCLASLAQQADCPTVEIIVADSSTDGTSELVRQRFPRVRLLHTDDPLPLADLRGLGITHSTGRVVAILDPYSVAAPDWARRVVNAHLERPEPVIGGAVGLHEPQARDLLQWALYFNEYGLFMPPNAAGPVSIVPGCNVSYKRALLFDGDRPRYTTFWKTFVNWDSEGHGHALRLDPDIHVDLNKPIPFVDFLQTRLLHGRCFAGMRVAGQPVSTRALRAATTPILPLVLMFRWTRAIWPKRRRRARFLATMPLQLVLFAAWSCGELCGYLAGAGTTCRRLYY